MAGGETIPATGTTGVKRDGPGRLCLLSQITDCQNVAAAVSERMRLREPINKCGERLPKTARIPERRCRFLIRTVF